MKKKMNVLACLCILMLTATQVYSQQNDPSCPPWVSENGYWVIESNIHRPGWQMIRFYDNDHTLVGEKELTSTRLNVKRKKIKMQLKWMLDSSLQSWARQHPGNDSTRLVNKSKAL